MKHIEENAWWGGVQQMRSKIKASVRAHWLQAGWCLNFLLPFPLWSFLTSILVSPCLCRDPHSSLRSTLVVFQAIFVVWLPFPWQGNLWCIMSIMIKNERLLTLFWIWYNSQFLKKSKTLKTESSWTQRFSAKSSCTVLLKMQNDKFENAKWFRNTDVSTLAEQGVLRCVVSPH